MLKMIRYKRRFSYLENSETTKVSRKNIIGILQDPVRNRRDEFVFKDKSLLDYTFD